MLSRGLKWLIFLLLFHPSLGHPDAPDALFKAGKFKEAAEALQAAWSNSQQKSPTLAYNAGTAWAQAGNTARAYGFLIKAAQLDPQDKDIKNNLDLVREKLPPEARNINPVFPWGVSVTSLSPIASETWLVISLLSLALALVGFCLKKMRGPGWALLVVAALFWALYGVIHWEQASPTAVIITEKPTLRSGPGESFSEIQTLSGGSWISIQDTQDGWKKVRFVSLSNEKETVGWISSADLFPL